MTWLFWIFFTISTILNIVLAFGIRRAIYKIQFYEDRYDETKQKIEQLYSDITYIDDMNLFEKDDYVGATFEGIKDVLRKYNNEI